MRVATCAGAADIYWGHFTVSDPARAFAFTIALGSRPALARCQRPAIYHRLSLPCFGATRLLRFVFGLGFGRAVRLPRTTFDLLIHLLTVRTIAHIQCAVS